ncbi:MAG: hypothetical protein ABI423_13825 [Burkholderiales bacterium]
MIQYWLRRSFRTAGVLGLLLVGQVAYAGEHCLFAHRMETTASRTANFGLCGEANIGTVKCFATSRHIDASVSTVLPAPDPQPGTVASHYAPRPEAAALQPRLYAGLAPGFAPPVYIRFGRFLS